VSGRAGKKAFIDNLLSANDSARGSPCGDDHSASRFLHSLRAVSGLTPALSSQQEYIGPMTAEELRSAIEEPARKGGWQFEPGLVDLILREVKNEAGALPLLSHALLETWQRRSGHWMTLKGYAEAGGVHSAIARTADQVFNRQLNEQQQEIARNIFLRLSDYDEEFIGMRRRAEISEFDLEWGSEDQVAHVLDILSTARLITISEHSIEIAHEALIREWPLLRQWLTEDRERVDQHHHLAEAAHRWEAWVETRASCTAARAWLRCWNGRRENSGSAQPPGIGISRSHPKTKNSASSAKKNSSGSASWKLLSTWLPLKSSAPKKIFAPTAACAFLRWHQPDIHRHVYHRLDRGRPAQSFKPFDPPGAFARVDLRRHHPTGVGPAAQHPARPRSRQRKPARSGACFSRMESALHQAVRASKQRLLLKIPSGKVNAAAFSRDGQLVAAGSMDGPFTSWMTIPGRSSRRLRVTRRDLLG
jgi:hypothetical protein